MRHIVVIGGGQAAASLVFKLRALEFDGKITLIGEEPVPPYQRPPLSKGYLLGDTDRERLFLKPLSAYSDHNIDLILGQPVDQIDPQSKTISLGSERIKYDELVITTGSSPIKLPAVIGGDLGGVYCVRTLGDIDGMAHEFSEGKKAVIVGGGYIGLEAAAVAKKKGVEVIVVEMATRILQRVASKETSDYFRQLHTDKGAVVIEGVGLERLEGDGAVNKAHLANGSSFDVDFVIVGVGIRPNTMLAENAGIDIENGIKVDEHGRTSAPNIWAAGDCASFPYHEGRIRLESVPNAIAAAENVAANIMGAETNYVAKPWFWSDQYDVKLQIAGLNTGYDKVITREGEQSGSTSHWYYKGDKLLAVDALNFPKACMIGKRLIEAGQSPAPETISDMSVAIKSLLSKS